jgi:carbon monoxide dehydrogenase subunit G
MKFQHQVTTQATRESLWAVLQDFPSVARCLPGVDEVRQVSDASYEGTLQVRIGPIGLRLTGTVDVEQDEDAGLWRMTAQALDPRVGGGAKATIEAVISELAPNVAGLDIQADVQFIGRLGEMGQPLIRRKADSMINDFARNLERLATEKE